MAGLNMTKQRKLPLPNPQGMPNMRSDPNQAKRRTSLGASATGLSTPTGPALAAPIPSGMQPAQRPFQPIMQTQGTQAQTATPMAPHTVRGAPTTNIGAAPQGGLNRAPSFTLAAPSGLAPGAPFQSQSPNTGFADKGGPPIPANTQSLFGASGQFNDLGNMSRVDGPNDAARGGPIWRSDRAPVLSGISPQQWAGMSDDQKYQTWASYHQSEWAPAGPFAQNLDSALERLQLYGEQGLSGSDRNILAEFERMKSGQGSVAGLSFDQIQQGGAQNFALTSEQIAQNNQIAQGLSITDPNDPFAAQQIAHSAPPSPGIPPPASVPPAGAAPPTQPGPDFGPTPPPGQGQPPVPADPNQTPPAQTPTPDGGQGAPVNPPGTVGPSSLSEVFNAPETGFVQDETPQIDPFTQDLQAEGTVEDRTLAMLTDGHPLLERAKQMALEQANASGLLNTSMGVQAGVSAMMDQAVQMASQDAAAFNTQALANMDATNAALAQNADYQQQVNLVNQQYAQQWNMMQGGGRVERQLMEAEYDRRLGELNANNDAMMDRLETELAGKLDQIQLTGGFEIDLQKLRNAGSAFTQMAASAAALIGDTLKTIPAMLTQDRFGPETVEQLIQDAFVDLQAGLSWIWDASGQPGDPPDFDFISTSSTIT